MKVDRVFDDYFSCLDLGTKYLKIIEITVFCYFEVLL